jgi:hypothetical protein
MLREDNKNNIKQKEDKRKWFIVMNSKLEYFCGMMYGGQLVWSHDYKEAKPLDDEAKFRTLESLCSGEELILDLIN